jgi:hypothetical protein
MDSKCLIIMNNCHKNQIESDIIMGGRKIISSI